MVELLEGSLILPAGLEKTVIHAVETALAFESRKGNVTVAILDDEEIHDMNRRFRQVDRPTDVLSFPAWEGEEILAPPDGFLGDLAISLPTAQRQAQEYGHSLERELVFLAVHGALHLMGFDHMTPEEEHQMLEEQKKILLEMGLTR